jgi:hypothetical protein
VVEKLGLQVHYKETIAEVGYELGEAGAGEEQRGRKGATRGGHS